MYEKLHRLGWRGNEGNPPTRDNSSPYEQALRHGVGERVVLAYDKKGRCSSDWIIGLTLAVMLLMLSPQALLGTLRADTDDLQMQCPQISAAPNKRAANKMQNVLSGYSICDCL